MVDITVNPSGKFGISLLTKDNLKDRIDKYVSIEEYKDNPFEGYEAFLINKMFHLRKILRDARSYTTIDDDVPVRDTFRQYLSGEVKEQIKRLEWALTFHREYKGTLEIYTKSKPNIAQCRELLHNPHAWTESGYLLKPYEELLK